MMHFMLVPSALRRSMQALNLSAGIVFLGIVGWYTPASRADTPYQWSSMLFQEYFEIGDLHLWNTVGGQQLFTLKSYKQSDNGKVSLSRDVSRSGSYSLKFSGGGGAEACFGFPGGDPFKGGAPQAEVYCRLSLYLGNDFSTNSRMTIASPATTQAGSLLFLMLNKSGNGFTLSANTYGGAFGTGTTVIAPGAWHTVEFHYKASVDGSFTVWLDGNAAPEITVNRSLTAHPEKVTVGAEGDVSQWQGTFYLDDVLASTTRIGAPGAELFLIYPDFRGRVSARVIAIVAGAESSDKVIATLDNTAIFEKAGPLNGRVDIPVNLKNLPTGNHALTVCLRNASNAIKDSATYAFDKSYPGDPLYAIDADNNFIKAGKKFFPVTSFGAELGEIKEWKQKNYCNLLLGVGWNDKDFLNYLNAAKAQGFDAAGPAHGVTPDNVKIKPADITEYINRCKSHSSVAWWQWREEPDNFGYGADDVKTWWDIGKKEDPSRPMENILMGYSCTNSWIPEMASYFWPRLTADILGWDTYPMGHWNETPPHGMKEFAQTAELCINWNWNLIPTIPFLQTAGCEGPNTPILDRCPTLEQILQMSWLMVVHGAKGIHWYPYPLDDASGTGVTNYQGMAAFTAQVDDLTEAILGETPANVTVTDDADADRHRVDLMTKKAPGGDLYIFAVRLTVPDETDTFSVNFTVSGATGPVEECVYLPSKSIRPVSSSCATFADKFAPNQVRIYRIKGSAPVSQPESVCPSGNGPIMVSMAGRSLRMRITLVASQHLRVGLFDIRGREVRVLADKSFSAGVHSLQCPLPAARGLYVVKLSGRNDRMIAKALVVR